MYYREKELLTSSVAQLVVFTCSKALFKLLLLYNELSENEDVLQLLVKTTVGEE